MRVTVARWYTPNDRSIDGAGLTPDQIVTATEAQVEAGEDPQLQAAIDHFEAALIAQP
jgi:carboxyl-terminal processing protease